MRKNIVRIVFFAVLLVFCLIPLQVWAAGPIVVFGDSQHSDDTQRRIVQAIVPLQPEAVFRVGDMTNDGRDPQLWKTFREINAPLLKKNSYFPCFGNHEYGSELYFDNFPFLKKQHWYSVDRQGIHFIILDSNLPLGPETEQYRWLKADLQAISSNTRMKVVLFHHPLFNLGWHTADEKILRPVLLPLFTEYGVQLVFSGHDHNYQRLEYKGITFIVTGGGGSSLVDKSRGSPFLKKYMKTHHFCVLFRDRDSLRVKVLDIDSNVIDEFSVPALVESVGAGR